MNYYIIINCSDEHHISINHFMVYLLNDLNQMNVNYLGSYCILECFKYNGKFIVLDETREKIRRTIQVKCDMNRKLLDKIHLKKGKYIIRYVRHMKIIIRGTG